MSLPELFTDAAAQPASTVDVEATWRRGRRRRAARAAGGAVALAGVLAVAVLTVPNLLLADVERVDLAGPAADSADTPPPAQPEPTAADVPERPWEELTLPEALDRLIAVNQAALPPDPAAGDVLLTHTVKAHPAYSPPHDVWEVTLHSEIVAPDGTRADRGGAVAEGLDPGADFRAVVAGADLEAMLATPPNGYQAPHDVDGDGVADPVGAALTDALLTEAEALPADLTAGPDGSSRLDLVVDALVGTVPSPQARARALAVLRGIDPALMEYRGFVPDLLGREGIGIVARLAVDGISGERMLIFSPETGALLGWESRFGAEPGAEPVLMEMAAIRDERLVDALP